MICSFKVWVGIIALIKTQSKKFIVLEITFAVRTMDPNSRKSAKSSNLSRKSTLLFIKTMSSTFPSTESFDHYLLTGEIGWSTKTTFPSLQKKRETWWKRKCLTINRFIRFFFLSNFFLPKQQAKKFPTRAQLANLNLKVGSH